MIVETKKAIVLIPARGGSKGLPGKNIKSFGGKPLIAHTIECAKKSNVVSDVYVSTDDEKIRQLSIISGAIVPFLRPKELASDGSPAIETYFHFLKFLEESHISIDELIILLPTCPLRLPSDIDNAYSLFVEKNADSVISMKAAEHPLDWYKIQNTNGVLISPEGINLNNNTNRQEYPKYLIPNGSIYIFNVSKLKKYKKYYFENSFPYIMPPERSIDIDTQLDFDIANFLYTRENYDI